MLKFLDKTVNFIKSTYLTDIKYNNNLLTSLRIFFERGNKFKSTLMTTGNVFRNSKWSDLAIFNIKYSFINKWFSFFSVILFFLILFCGLADFSTVTKYLSFLPFYNLLLALTNTFFSTTYYVVNKIIIFIFWLRIIHINLRLFSPTLIYKDLLNSTTFIKTYNFNIRNTNSARLILTQKGPLFLKNNFTKLNKFYILHKNILLTGLNPSDTTSINLPLYTPTKLSLMFLSSADNFKRFQDLNFLKKIYEYEIGTISTSEIHFLNKNLTLLNLNSYLNMGGGTVFNNFNLLNILNIFKEERWILKNSLISNKSFSNLNNFTLFKKFINNNNYNSDLTNNNIWASSKLSLLHNYKINLFLNQTSNSLLNPTTLNNFKFNNTLLKHTNLYYLNFYENSYAWIFKKNLLTTATERNIFTYLNEPKNALLSRTKRPDSNLHFTTLNLNLSTSIIHNFFYFRSDNWIFKNNLLHTSNTNYNINQTISTGTLNYDILNYYNSKFLLNLTSNTTKNYFFTKYNKVPYLNDMCILKF